MTTIIEQGTTDLGLDEVIVVSGVSIHGERTADLRVRRGEVVALVGANGAGKSTVSRAVVGARPATAGSVRVLGLDPVGDRDELKLRVGFLVKDLETMGSLSSRDVLDICAAVRGCTPAFAVELAERLRLDLDRPMGQLCRGQLRRLGLVQAFMHRPDVVVLDDAMADLDEHGRRELAVVLREAAAAGAAVLVTATSADDVEGCATRIATFSARPEAETTVEAVLDAEAAEVAVLGEAAEAAVLGDAAEAAVPDVAAATVGEVRAPRSMPAAGAGRGAVAADRDLRPVTRTSAMERWLDLGSPVEAWQPTRRTARRRTVRMRTSSRSP